MPAEILTHVLPKLYHLSEDGDHDLVANTSGTCLYKKSEAWGRLWTILYSFIKLFVGNRIEVESLRQVLLKTAEAFKQNLREINQHVQRYERFLSQAGRGFRYKEEELCEMHYAITNWNNTITPFLELIRKQKNQEITLLFQRYTGKEIDNITQLFDTEIVKSTRKLQSIIDLESICEAALPYESLVRYSTGGEDVLNGQRLYDENKKEFRAFVKKINARGDEIGVRLFHRAIKTLLSYAVDKEANATRLEMNLLDVKCNLSLEADPEFLAWRDTLKPGQTLRFRSVANPKGCEITLGEQIGKKPGGSDDNIFFAIKERPKELLWLSTNEALINIRYWQHSQYTRDLGPDAVITPFGFRDIDNRGRFAIIERLHQPIDAHTWTSTSKQLTEEDELKCKKINQLIQELISASRTPISFSPNSCMLDQNGRIRFCKILQEGPFDFNVLEDFVFAFANKNAIVFRYIMRASGLGAHRHAEFYKRVVANIEKAEYADSADIAKHMGGGKIPVSVIDRGKELMDAAMEMIDRCARAAQKEHRGRFKEIQKKAAQVFIKCYQQSGTAGFLWPGLEDGIYKELCDELVAAQG